MKLKWLYPVIFSTALVTYSVFTLLDAFVIKKDVVSVAELKAAYSQYSEEGSDSSSVDISANEDIYSELSPESDSKITLESYSGSSTESAEEKFTNPLPDAASPGITITDTSYKGNGIDVSVSEARVNDTTVYIADVKVTDMSLLNSGLAADSFGRNVSEKTSSIAERVGAVLAINGDYYGFRNTGYVMRNGLLYRSSKGNDNGDLVLYADGNMDIIYESDITAETLQAQGITDIWSFGPALVDDGSIVVGKNDEVGRSMNSNPRTAIGMITPGHYIFAVSDGRTNESEGLTLYELAEVMEDLGCTVAYNLDGGGSSTMYFNGNIINNPTTNGRSVKERAVSDIIFVGS